jgi:hypothetical protein
MDGPAAREEPYFRLISRLSDHCRPAERLPSGMPLGIPGCKILEVCEGQTLEHPLTMLLGVPSDTYRIMFHGFNTWRVGRLTVVSDCAIVVIRSRSVNELVESTRARLRIVATAQSEPTMSIEPFKSERVILAADNRHLSGSGSWTSGPVFVRNSIIKVRD